jgi:hypothetical protein
MHKLIQDALMRLQFLPNNMELPYLEGYQAAIDYYGKIVTDQERIEFLMTAKSLFDRERDDWKGEDPILADALQWEADKIQAAIDYLKAPVDGQLLLLES